MKILGAFVMGIILLKCEPQKIENCKGEPKPDQICTMEYDPVCGCDGKTYSNACQADAAGIKKWIKGECK